MRRVIVSGIMLTSREGDSTASPCEQPRGPMNDGVVEQERELEDHRPHLVLLVRVWVRELVDPRIGARIDQSGVVQETMLKALKAMRKEHVENVRLWLTRIANNTLRDAVRRISRKGGQEVALDAATDSSVSHLQAWLIADQSSPSERAIRHEEEPLLADRARRLAEAMNKLSEVEHYVLVQCIQQHQRHAVVAERIGRTVPAVRGLLARTLDKARKAVAHEGSIS